MSEESNYEFVQYHLVVLDVGNTFIYFAWSLKLRYKKSRNALRSLSAVCVKCV